MIRIFTFVAALCLTLQAGAATGELRSGIKTLFDQYNYTMQVQWDQKDEVVPQTAREELLKGLESLRNRGVSEQEIAAEALLQVKDVQLQTQMNEILKLSRTTGMTAKETEEFAMKALGASLNQGANWSGENARTTLGILVAIGLIAFLAVVSDKCPSEGTCYECDLAYDECP